MARSRVQMSRDVRGLSSPLAGQELADPAVFSAATRNIPYYNPSYDFERIAHVHLAGLPLIMQRGLKLAPGWDNSSFTSLMFERESLLVLIGTLAVVLTLILVCLSLHRYRENCLGIRSVGFARRLGHSYRSFVNPAS